MSVINDSLLTIRGFMIRGFMVSAVMLVHGYAMPAEIVCSSYAKQDLAFLVVSSVPSPDWVDDGGHSTCAWTWQESRLHEIRVRNGWFYVYVSCRGGQAGATFLAGRINPALGFTVATVFGAGCSIIEQEAEYEWVIVTQYRTCERYYNFIVQRCLTGCSPWR